MLNAAGVVRGVNQRSRKVDDPGIVGQPPDGDFTSNKQGFPHIAEGMPAFERLPETIKTIPSSSERRDPLSQA